MYTLDYANLLRDCLHNLHPDEVSNDMYCRGLIVGIVSALSAAGVEYKTAIKIVAFNLPPSYKVESLPSAFEEDIVRLQPPK